MKDKEWFIRAEKKQKFFAICQLARLKKDSKLANEALQLYYEIWPETKKWEDYIREATHK